MTRRAILTLFPHRPPEVGVPEDNPNLTEPGLVVRGFIERIDDPAPFVAPDGSTHQTGALAVEALDAIARAVGNGPPAAIAVPGYWGENTVAKLREALRQKPALVPGGVPPALISDATTSVAALYAKPGFPTDGVVALCDFGAGGTSVTLTDAAANFRHIGETVRYTDFSGNQIDQAILSHLPAGARNSSNTNAAGTEPLAPPTQLLEECRRAKEQLSSATVAVVPAHTPSVGEDIRLSRAELENLISGPLERFVTTLQEILQRNEIPTTRLAAVATVGGGACIPRVTQQLEERLQVPVVTTRQPTLSAAIGAAVLAEEQSSADGGDATTALGAATTRLNLDAAAPTDMIPAAWAAEAARAAAGQSPEDGARSATYRALAWSQDASTGDEPVPYTGEDHSDDDYGPTEAPAAVAVEPAAPAPEPRPRRKRPGVLFSLVAAAALTALLAAGLVTFKLSTSTTSPRQNTTTVAPSRLPKVGPIPPPPPPTSEAPPPPASTESVPPPAPPPSATEPPVTTTVPTTTVPTTTVPTTTVPTTTVPTTTAPTTNWPTTTPPTTSYSYPPYAPYPPTTTNRIPPWVPVMPPYYR